MTEFLVDELSAIADQDAGPAIRPASVLGYRRHAFDIAAGVPICGFTGINGAGKTLLLVESAIADMISGRPVYSTVPIEWIDPKTGELYQSIPITSLRELLELRDVTIVLDEVSVIFSSRATATLPGEIVTLLQVLRHRGCTLRWSAPAWMRCDNLIREVTQAVVNVHPLAKKHDGSPWPTPRLVMAGLMDTSHGKTDATPEKVLKRRMVNPRRLRAFGAYDTQADTPILGRRHRGGRCIDCGGTMDVPKHSQALHEHLGLPFYEADEAPARSTARLSDGRDSQAVVSGLGRRYPGGSGR
jgi:hypothetical protein